ncbi:uncharacterized protein DDB_G0287625-like [Anopheles stephensi]|uniref:uncharacterized protein DDB_G0287625-like n=1 Tax=Anopheles stephensi TaxID=30069 RepID=UPI0007D5D724|nr:uncharacterized protein DDB_G0287625-like [Anopheles stephensi]
MLPYILNILHHSGSSQNFPTICQKLRQFSMHAELTDEDIETPAKDALDKAIEMGLVRRNSNSNTYDLTHKWFVPESQSFQARLYGVVRDMQDALNESSEQSDSEDLSTTSNQQPPADCMGPGMAQKRSPAQIRAIAIYRRMREQREREEREAAARARNRRNSGTRSRSRSRSRGRRSSTTSRARSRSQRRRSSTRARSRSTSRARSSSRSRRRR